MQKDREEIQQVVASNKLDDFYKPVTTDRAQQLLKEIREKYIQTKVSADVDISEVCMDCHRVD